MKFEDRHVFAKPMAAVLKMFGDRAYFEKKYKALPGVKDFEVLECETKGKKFRIKHRSLQKSDIPLPDFAKKFIAEHNTVIQQDSWDLETGAGRLDIEVKGVPIKISADMQVSADRQGCVNDFVWSVSSGIPLLGGKLERILSDDIKAKSAADAALSNKLLKDY